MYNNNLMLRSTCHTNFQKDTKILISLLCREVIELGGMNSATFDCLIFIECFKTFIWEIEPCEIEPCELHETISALWGCTQEKERWWFQKELWLKNGKVFKIVHDKIE